MSALPQIDPADTRLVIFDCDGVLVDSEPLANAVMADHITRLGWAMDGRQAMARFRGKTLRQVHAAIETHLGREIDFAWKAAFDIDRNRVMAERIEAVPGAAALLDRVEAAGIGACVASQGSHAKMAITLGRTGFLPRMEGRVFSASDVARPKPAPDLFLHAANAMGAPAELCVVIEDSATGVAAARAAGMRVIGLDAEGTGALDGGGADIVRALAGIRVLEPVS